jgi:hypothetical protein
MHSGEQPFCFMWVTSISINSTLQIHQVLHRGERSFCYDVCRKSFSFQSSLKRHQCLHSGEQPLRCYVCIKSFCQNFLNTYHHWVHNRSSHLALMCIRSLLVIRMFGRDIIAHMLFARLLPWCDACSVRSGRLLCLVLAIFFQTFVNTVIFIFF